MKRVPPVLAVGVLLTAGCFGIYVRGPGFIRALSLYAYDAILGAARRPPQSGRVAIVDVDDASLGPERGLGQWPWPRLIMAELSDRLLDSGAAVVAFDMMFSEADRGSPAVVARDLGRLLNTNVFLAGVPAELADFDERFADSLGRGATVLGCFVHPAKGPGEIPERMDTNLPGDYDHHVVAVGKGDVFAHVFKARSVAMSLPVLARAARAGFFNAVPDADNVVRRSPMVWAWSRSQFCPSLALEAVRLGLGAARCQVEHDENGLARIRLLPGEAGGAACSVPTDLAGNFIINYRAGREDPRTGRFASLPTFSAADILEGRVPAGALAGKVVFVGTSAVGLKDIKATPLAEQFSGVEIHATIADNILAGDMLRDPSWMVSVHAASIVLIGLALSGLIYRGRAWLSFLVAAALIAAAVLAGVLLLRRHHLVFVPAWTVVSIIVIYPVLTMIRFWEEEVQRRRVRAMFGAMVSEEVLRYLEHHPETFSLTGHRAAATMFFSDIRGFTTITERLAPERLAELLNGYLTPMASIIMSRKGYVDKYEGDLIMAEWGVPFALEDHALQACLAALEQQEEIARLRPELSRRFGAELHVRMGLNTGLVTAGMMGSERRMQYTVMGDAVNLAARLEPANKDYGTRVIIGAATREAAGPRIETRLLDRALLAGKSEPVEIYELLGVAGGVPPARLECARRYEEALRLHWERRWAEALAALEKAPALEGEDVPSRILRRRIHHYQARPPEADWKGQWARFDGKG